MCISAVLRNSTVVAVRIQNIACFSQQHFVRQFSALSKRTAAISNQNDDSRAKANARRAYAIGGCLVFLWLSTHGLLLYRRRDEHRYFNKKNPPIPWEDFVEKYLMRGMVKTIVYQPQFGTGNAFLHPATEKLFSKAVLDRVHFAPGKFSRTPDVRFSFLGDGIALEKVVHDLRGANNNSSVPLKDVEFKIDEFPNYWEMVFIAISTLLTIAAVT